MWIRFDGKADGEERSASLTNIRWSIHITLENIVLWVSFWFYRCHKSSQIEYRTSNIHTHVLTIKWFLSIALWIRSNWFQCFSTLLILTHPKSTYMYIYLFSFHLAIKLCRKLNTNRFAWFSINSQCNRLPFSVCRNDI